MFSNRTGIPFFSRRKKQTEKANGRETGEWNALCRRARGIADAAGNPALKAFAEELGRSDPAPTELDGQLKAMLEILSSYADAENIRKAHQLLQKRNALSGKGNGA